MNGCCFIFVGSKRMELTIFAMRETLWTDNREIEGIERDI